MVKQFINYIKNLINLITKKMKDIKIKPIPVEVQDLLDDAANLYTTSKATTNAGVFLRMFSKLFSPSVIIKMFAHKLTKQ